MKKEKRDCFGKLKTILILLSIFAAVKMLFFAFGLDEEYQLVMAYRNVRGDTLFRDMWEPHQSSAFLCTLLMLPYTALFGTFGVVLYLRLCGMLLHLAVSCYLYRVLKRSVGRDGAFFLGLIYFNTIPKQIMLPEFGIMQVWFFTLLMLFLTEYYEDSRVESLGFSGSLTSASYGGNVRKRRYLVLAAFSLVLETLSYPSCAVLYFFVLWVIWRRSGRERWKDMGIVTLLCAGCGAGYAALLLRHNTIEGLLSTLSYIISGDVTHSLGIFDKLSSLGKDLITPVILCAGIFLAAEAAAGLLEKESKKSAEVSGCGETTGRCGKMAAVHAALCRAGADKDSARLVCAVALACLVEVFYWVVKNAGYESMQIHLIVFTLLGIRYRAPASGGRQRDDRALQRGLLLDGIIGAGISLLAVIYLTDLNVMDSVPHAMPAAFFGMALIMIRWEEQEEIPRVAQGCWKEEPGGVSPTRQESLPQKPSLPAAAKSRPSSCVCIVLTLWALTAILGKGYTLRSGTGYHNVLQSGGILKYGPAAGTISDYMGAYIYNCDYEDWQGSIQDGDNVLIMVEQVMNSGTIQYLFKDVNICHYSVVNPTAYDERLLRYWELFPEKSPNVIIVDAWYGQLMTDENGWLMRYIEKDFGYSDVSEGRYIRIYRK